jgi:signal peptidase II
MPGQDRRKTGLFLNAAALVVILDQLSKLWIRDNLVPGESLPIVGRLNLTYIWNTGSAFGLLANQAFLLTILTLASLLIILLFLHYLHPATTLGIVSPGLIFGGAVGNLIDRLRLGYVTDFIDVRLWGNFHWPTFNLADTAVVVGIFTLIYFLYRSGIFRKVYEHNHRAEN